MANSSFDAEPGNEMMDEVGRFVERTLSVISYVRATLSPGNRFSTERKDWEAVHVGRAASSCAQLDHLEREALKVRAVLSKRSLR